MNYRGIAFTIIKNTFQLLKTQNCNIYQFLQVKRKLYLFENYTDVYIFHTDISDYGKS